MASCRFLHHRNQLAEIRNVLGDLSRSQSHVEAALGQLAEVLLQCAKAGENDTRNLCFKLGVVKATLGILRSSSQVSLLAVAAKCLALLTHGNEEARTELGERGAVGIMLNLLTPRTHPSGRESPLWPEEWIPVYEQALVCLTKLTYHCSSNQRELAQLGGVKLILDIAMDKHLLSNYNRYPSGTRRHLKELTLRKKFASRVVPVPRDQREGILRRFPVLSMPGETGVGMHYPVFLVELVAKDSWVSLELAKRGVVWPDTTPLPEGAKWTCVVVQEVEGACHFWCQFCTEQPSPAIERMKTSLAELAPPNLEQVTVSDPTVRDVYAAFSAPPLNPFTPDEAVREQWFRVRLLRKSLEGVKVLAVDFGFTLTLPLARLHPLPSQCRGIPPQAIPCKLHGVCPIPASICILEHSAAVISNMAFESYALRKEIQTFKGIEAMIKLAESASQRVVVHALGALLNMAVTETMREEVGKKGAMKAALSLLERGKACEGDVLEYALALLLNCTTYTSNCVSLLARLKGETVLKQLEYDQLSVPQAQGKRITDLVTKLLFFISCSQNNGNSPKAKSANNFSKSTSAKSSSVSRLKERSTDATPPKTAIHRARVIANGERVSKPIVKCLLSETSTPDLQSPSNSPRSAPHTGTRISTRPLVLGKKLTTCFSRERSAFFSVANIQQCSARPLVRLICGMMNGSSGGRVYMGVDKSGIVRGCHISKKQRDSLRIGLDGLMHTSFSPPIQSDQYEVSFLPVAKLPQKTNNAAMARPQVVADLYVVQLVLRPAEYKGQVYTVEGKDAKGISCQWCYHFSKLGVNEELSYQELRDLLAAKKAERFMTEVVALRNRIDTLMANHSKYIAV